MKRKKGVDKSARNKSLEEIGRKGKMTPPPKKKKINLIRRKMTPKEKVKGDNMGQTKTQNYRTLSEVI